MAAELSEAAAASISWAVSNGVTFDHGKTEAAIFHRKRKAPTATVTVGANTVPFNKEATRWLGVWLDSQLTLKGHHATQLKEGKKAMARLRGLIGQMDYGALTGQLQESHDGLHPVGRHVRSGAVVDVPGTIGRADELQLLVN